MRNGQAAECGKSNHASGTKENEKADARSFTDSFGSSQESENEHARSSWTGRFLGLLGAPSHRHRMGITECSEGTGNRSADPTMPRPSCTMALG